MDLSKVLSITGKSGLFKLVSQTKSNFIVESLTDGKRFPAFSHDGVAILDNIAIFTDEDDKPLGDIFQAIYKKESGRKTPDILNNNTQLKSYFEEILPNYDRERVYVSNIKKVLAWYNLLIEHNLIQADEEKTDTAATEEARDE